MNRFSHRLLWIVASLALTLGLSAVSEADAQSQSRISVNVGRIRNLQFDNRQNFHSPYAEVEISRGISDRALRPFHLDGSFFIGAWYEPDYRQFWDNCMPSCEYESHKSVVSGTRAVLGINGQSLEAAVFGGFSSHFIWSDGARRGEKDAYTGGFLDVLGAAELGIRLGVVVSRRVRMGGRFGRVFFLANSDFQIDPRNTLTFSSSFFLD